MKTVVIAGATSPIAAAVARRFGADGYRVVLAARRPGQVDDLRQEIDNIPDASAAAYQLDVMVPASLSAFLEQFTDDVPDIVISLLGRQEDPESRRDDPAYIESLMAGNLLAPTILLEQFATRMQSRGKGTLIGVSSIVGDRGRARNYTYGAGKAGFTTFLSGLRQRLDGSGVHVVTVKPGVVAVPGRKTRHPRWLLASPDTVAAAIVRAARRRQDVVYTPWFWRWVSWLVRIIPEALFRRLTF